MMPRSKFLWLLAATFLANLHGPSLVGQESNKSSEITSIQLYYGGDQTLVKSLIDHIKPQQLVVVDLRSLTAYQLGKLRRATSASGATLIAYISIGELHSRELKMFEEFAVKQDKTVDIVALKAQTFIGENTEFESLHTDVSEDMWREFVLDKAKNILAAGVDGLFLDTVDTVDVYCEKREWSLERRSKSVTAMMALVRELKSLDGALDGANHVMQNRGLNIIGETVFIGNESGTTIPGLSIAGSTDQHNPDSVLYENAMFGQDDWSQAKLRQLDEIQRSGNATVVALGYSDNFADKNAFLKKCRSHRFVPAWSANSHDLHKQIARTETVSNE